MVVSDYEYVIQLGWNVQEKYKNSLDYIYWQFTITNQNILKFINIFPFC
jgi:hypothetical protein